MNGHELAHDADTAADGPDVSLENRDLIVGVNRVQLITVPFSDGKNHIPDRTRLGAVQAWEPAQPWQRHAFNAYAEAIVESTGESGDLTLVARSSGLESGRVTVAVRPPMPPVP